MKINFTFNVGILIILLSTSASYSQIQTVSSHTIGYIVRNALYCDANNVVWLGSSSSGLTRYDNGVTQQYNMSNSGIASDHCNAITQDKSGKIWAGSADGISVFDGNSWQIYTTQNSSLPVNAINCLYTADNGVWAGTNAGLSWFDGTNWTTFTTANSGLASDTVYTVVSNSNTIYIGTKQGLSVFNNGTWSTILPSFSNYAVPNLVYANGRLWMFGSNSFWAGYVDQGSFVQYSPAILWNALGSDKNGNLFGIGTHNNLRAFYKIGPDLSTSFIRIAYDATAPIVPLFTIGSNDHVYIMSRLSSSSLHHFQLDLSLAQDQVYIPGLDNDWLIGNQVSARILNRGDMHWDPIGQTPQYEVPKGSNKVSIYCSALWLGGLDQNGLLHTAANTYRQNGGTDYYTGPLDTITGLTDSVTSAYYDRFWKIDREMIEKFRYNFRRGNIQNGTYRIPEAIATWPAHGTGNYSRQLAPFIDENGDGVYNPNDGDYPELTGHQMLWWVFNDTLGRHYETNGRPFQFEIHGKAYAFNCDENLSADEVMNYTTFYQYKIINRSQNIYSDMYAGIWTDFDLGNASDDYVGCDSMLNSYFVYNGDNNDDGGGGYGLNPPMVNLTLLKGPKALINDGLDNNHNGETDEADEPNGLNTFLRDDGSWLPTGDPETALDYYRFLQAIWKDGQPLTYGSNGYNTGNPVTTFMYSGVPYDLQPGNWTMPGAGIQPTDVRVVGGSGPFSIAPGESQTLDFAYIFTRDSVNSNGLTTSVAKNRADVQKVIDGFNSGNYPCRSSFVSEDPDAPFDFTIYPNPVQSNLFINWQLAGSPYEIYSCNGQLVRKGTYSFAGIDVNTLASQLYLIRVEHDGKSLSKRFLRVE